jgi:hypothetical protein
VSCVIALEVLEQQGLSESIENCLNAAMFIFNTVDQIKT